MKSFAAGFIERQPVTQNLLRTVRLLGEYKGRTELFKQQLPQALDTLRQAALIQSTESSNRIEGVTAPLARIQALVAKKARPRNRSEQEIAGYRDVLSAIHTNHENIPVTTGVALQLHRDLYHYAGVGGGRWKSVDNEITEVQPDGTKITRFRPVAAFATPAAMEDLHRSFNDLWRSGEVEPLLLIPAYVLDFLCIHPFLDGNGRMARLLSLLLLYHAGFEVGRYISLEMIVEKSKESYYEALQLSSQGWHEGAHSLLPWTEYFLGVLVAAYRDFEQRVGLLTTARGAKTEMVLEAIRTIRGEFSVRQLQERCPHSGIDLIHRLLREQRQAGTLECLGRGPEARWRRI